MPMRSVLPLWDTYEGLHIRRSSLGTLSPTTGQRNCCLLFSNSAATRKGNLMTQLEKILIKILRNIYRVTTINVSLKWIEWAEWAALSCTANSPFPGHVYRRHPVDS